jgi:hypothetical protein
MSNVTFKGLTEIQKAELKVAASERGLSVSALIRLLIIDHLKKSQNVAMAQG